ncbi:hypothetical protein BDF14DRAFT_1886444 [Spinellus fusiger]|nr:hypothetical protein BDF14DRAFT_1886444 [Spinellus fusiger]
MPASIPHDFQSGTIEHHWNDPPKTIFQPHLQNYTTLSIDGIETALVTVLGVCESTYTTGMDEKIVKDTLPRIHTMLAEVRKGTTTDAWNSVLGGFAKALEEKQWDQALAIHTQSMAVDYEKHGAWLLGMKRLLDLYQRACVSTSLKTRSAILHKVLNLKSTQVEVSYMFNMPASTVRDTVKHYMETNQVEPSPKSGGKRKLNDKALQ